MSFQDEIVDESIDDEGMRGHFGGDGNVWGDENDENAYDMDGDEEKNDENAYDMDGDEEKNDQNEEEDFNFDAEQGEDVDMDFGEDKKLVKKEKPKKTP